jgi:hypothetical protein
MGYTAEIKKKGTTIIQILEHIIVVSKQRFDTRVREILSQHLHVVLTAVATVHIGNSMEENS